MSLNIKIADASASKREKDANGFLIIRDNPIAKAGVFDYLLSEVSAEKVDSNTDSIVRVCREFSDLCANKDTFLGKPIKDTHIWTGENGSENNASGAIYGDIREQEPYLVSDLIIYDPELIAKIENGEAVELSPAYEAELVKSSGTYDGEPYSYLQRLKCVNHLAVVETGRSGKDLRIQDSKGAVAMEKKKFMDTLTKLLFKDSDGEQKPEQKQMDGDKSELVAKIIAAANSSELDEAAKAEAIMALASELSGHEAMTDEDTEEKKSEDSEEEKKQEDEGEEVVGEKEISITPSELAEIIEKVTDSAVSKQIAKFKDSISKQEAEVNNAYNEVSRELGHSFDARGFSASDIYKFGAESLLKTKLADGLDAVTAFRMAVATRPATKQVKVADAKVQDAEQEKLRNLLYGKK